MSLDILGIIPEDYDTHIVGPRRGKIEENGGADEVHQRVQGGGTDTKGRRTNVQQSRTKTAT